MWWPIVSAGAENQDIPRPARLPKFEVTGSVLPSENNPDAAMWVANAKSKLHGSGNYEALILLQTANQIAFQDFLANPQHPHTDSGALQLYLNQRSDQLSKETALVESAANNKTENPNGRIMVVLVDLLLLPRLVNHNIPLHH